MKGDVCCHTTLQTIGRVLGSGLSGGRCGDQAWGPLPNRCLKVPVDCLVSLFFPNSPSFSLRQATFPLSKI